MPLLYIFSSPFLCIFILPLTTAYANSLPITQKGGMLQIEIVNPVSYASFVEYGHRQSPGRFVPALGKRLKAGWVEGRKMMTISEKEVQQWADGNLEKKLEAHLREVFK